MSNFKMKHQGAPALMKTLTSGQQGMIKSMKKSGKTAQAESIKKGIEDAPVKKEGKTLSPEENRRVSDYRQGKGRVKVTTSRNSRGAGKLAGGTGETDQKLDGYGEINTKVAGSRGSRMTNDGRGNSTRVVKEASASRIKSRGVQSPKVKKTDISKDLKERAPRKKVKKVNEITKTAAVKKVSGDKGKKKKDNFRYESDAREVVGTAYTKKGTERVTEYKPSGKTMKKGDSYQRGGFQTPKKVVDTGRDSSGRKKAGRTGTVDVEVKKGDVRFSTGKKTKKKTAAVKKKGVKGLNKAAVKKYGKKK